jgi:hypothetical protein
MSCIVSKKNLGKSKCNKLPTVPKMMITTPNEFFLAPADFADDAALKVKLQALLLNPSASRGYLWPQFSLFENRSEEAQYEDTVLGMWPMRDGQYRYFFGITKNMCTHKAMFSHRAVNEGRVFIIDLDNQIWGTEDPATGNIMGFSIGLLHTEKMMIGDGSSNSTKSPVFLCLADNEEFDKNGALIETGIINQLERLTDVEIKAATAFAAAGFTVDVKQVCDQIGVNGLLMADFLLYAADGVTLQTLQSVTPDPNVDGRYAIVAPGGNLFESGSLALRAPSLLTVKAYETPKKLTVTI